MNVLPGKVGTGFGKTLESHWGEHWDCTDVAFPMRYQQCHTCQNPNEKSPAKTGLQSSPGRTRRFSPCWGDIGFALGTRNVTKTYSKSYWDGVGISLGLRCPRRSHVCHT